MRVVEDKNLIIDLRPYFIDLRKGLAVAEVPREGNLVDLKAKPERIDDSKIKKSSYAPSFIKKAAIKKEKVKPAFAPSPHPSAAKAMVGKKATEGHSKATAGKEGKSIIRGAFEYAAYAVIFVLLVWGTPLGLTKVLESEQPIASITSSSMWPVLKRGDIVFIKGVHEKADVKLSDIVVFENERGYTIHRVVKLRDDTLVTRGDANNIDDKPVGYDKVVGKAVTWSNGNVVNIPQIGKFSQSVQSIKGMITKTVSASLP